MIYYMKTFSTFIILLLFTGAAFAQLSYSVTDDTERRGVPAVKLEWNQEQLPYNAQGYMEFALEIPVDFTCFGLGWNTDADLPPSAFKLEYRVKKEGESWSRWIAAEGDFAPDQTPTEMYWTDALFTHDATEHQQLEVKFYPPQNVTVDYLRIDAFNGNVETEMTDRPKSDFDDNKSGLRNCPEFPNMIPRSEWCGGTAPCGSVLAGYNPTYINATHVVIHHGASPDTYTSGLSVVRSYWNYHVNTLNWADIGYNYLLDKFGNFYQGRHNPNIPTSDVRGAHAGAANGGSIGICFVGNADVTISTQVQLDRSYEFLAWWFDHKAYDPQESAGMQTQSYGWQTMPRLTNHRDIGQTFCPGNNLYNQMQTFRNQTQAIIDDCSGPQDDVPPTTDVIENYDWRGYDYWTYFSDEDNPGGTGVDERYYQVMEFDGSEWRGNSDNGFFNDNFNTAIHSEWTTFAGTWSIQSGNLIQNDETVANSNIYAQLNQDSETAFMYQWSARMSGTDDNRRSGLHFFVDDPEGDNRGNSYLAWFRLDDDAFQFYRIENDQLNLVVNNFPIGLSANNWHDFKVTFNPQNGKMEAFMDNELVGEWTDTDPYTAGQYISLRNGNAITEFDNLKVRKSRDTRAFVTIGPETYKDARYESPNDQQDACRINTIVKDGAGNWSTQAAQNIFVDWTPPTTESSVANDWQTEDFTVDFDDEDNVDGSGLDRRFYQVIDTDGVEWRANATRGFFSDNFVNGIHPEWTSFVGDWNADNGYLEQTDEAENNSNIYAALNQNLSNRYLYHFQMKIEGAGNNKRAGLHYFADDPEATNRGNSYFVWFRVELATLEFYKVSNDTFSQELVVPLETNEGQWYDTKIVYDRVTGETFVYRDDKLIGEWRDNDPIFNGDYISFRSGNSHLSVNNLKVYRTRLPSTTVTVGEDPDDDIRYQNQDPLSPAAKVKSIVTDVANNVSEIYYHELDVDWTAPDDVDYVNDGTAADIDTFYTANEISANWAASADPHSDVYGYQFSVGSSPGLSDVVDWVDVGDVTSHTETGLNLIYDETYYINIKAENNALLESDIISSDGQVLIDETTQVEAYEQHPFNIYPNPAQDRIVLDFENNFNPETIRLMNSLGQLVKSIDITNAQTHYQLDLSVMSLSEGIYFIQISSVGETYTEKVIVKR